MTETDTDIPSSQSSTQTEEDVHQEHINALPMSFQVLIQNGTLNCLCNILSEYSQLKDFENLLRNITLGKIPPRNICWLLSLHLGRLTSLTSTTAMRWDEEIVEFFQLFTCYLELLLLMFCVAQCTSVTLLWKMLNTASSTQEVQK